MSDRTIMDLTNDIIVIPNLVPISVQDEIETVMTSLQFSWYYKHNISAHPSDPQIFKNDPNIKVRDAFVHMFYAEDINYISNYFLMVKPLTYFLEEKTGVVIEKLLRLRGVLTYRDPSWNQEHYLTPHVDQERPHWTMIYYVNDCDGPTHFYEDMFDLNTSNFNKRVLSSSYTPKKGTCILFNGLRYHSNGVGNNKNRVTININFIPNFDYVEKSAGEFI